MIIEDAPKLADIFSLALQSIQFETEIIQDGEDALNRLAEITPAVVVLDLHLPRVSGRDILRQIRSDERLTKTRIMVAITDALIAEKLRGEADLVLL